MPSKKNAVTDFARHSLKKTTIVCELVKLACQRHIDDLKRKDIVFDVEASRRATDFFGFLCHSKGEWAGQPFKLEPWQEFVIGSIFGWKRKDGLRRFRTAYNAIPRKNGKSTLSAGVALYMLAADGEKGAEIYSAATSREQAKIVFGEAKRMVEASPSLKKRIGVFINNLHIEGTASKFMPLSSESSTMDGLNIHCAIVDELHEHKTSQVIDKLETATGSRRQPLIFEITTSGYDKNSICYNHHDYSVKILKGIVKDDSWFTFVSMLDEGDSWDDPKTWQKSNPNWGVSVKIDDLERKATKAKEMPAAQNAFRRLHCNEWTEQANRWLDMNVWDENNKGINISDYHGRECFAGLDLSSTQDLTAFVLVFPEEQGYSVIPYTWIPSETIAMRVKRDRAPYDIWKQEGLIEVTEGNVVDYDLIRKRVNDLGKDFNIREIAIDRWNSTHLQTQLMGDGFTVIPFGQGFVSMSAPTKEIEKCVIQRTLNHGGNNPLRWMASNVAVQQDPAGNLKPAKDKSTEKIDGIVAMIMGVGRAMVREEIHESVYHERGILVI
jgi:phage terminase large subunit-like protein